MVTNGGCNIFGSQFLGSMLPQYMALFVRLIRVSNKKNVVCCLVPFAALFTIWVLVSPVFPLIDQFIKDSRLIGREEGSEHL